jgi:hypothetical protein
MSRPGVQAVICGERMAGLLTAQVLSISSEPSFS